LVNGWSHNTKDVILFSNSIVSADACEASCKSNSTCAGFTWHDKTTGSFYKWCFFVLNPANVWARAIVEAGHDSGICNHGKLHPNLREAETFFDRLASGPSEPPSWGYDKAYVRPSTNPPRSTGWRAGVPQLPAPASAASEVYVDYVAGSDSNDGSKESPFKTIAVAVAHSTSVPAPRTIYLETSGTHYVKAPIMLSAEHSGTTITSAPISSSASSSSDASGAVVSGGVPLKLTWTMTGTGSPINTSAVKDGSTVFQATLSAGTPPFLELFNASNARFVPAREPDGNPELDENNYNAHAASWLPARDFGKATVVDNSSCPGLPPDACNRGGMVSETVDVCLVVHLQRTLAFCVDLVP
jgi:hypothetical protein